MVWLDDYRNAKTVLFLRLTAKRRWNQGLFKKIRGFQGGENRPAIPNLKLFQLQSMAQTNEFPFQLNTEEFAGW